MQPARYLVFGGEFYYARGGAHDLLSSHARLEDAVAHGRAADVQWWHVYDTHEARIVTGTKEQAYDAPDITDGEARP